MSLPRIASQARNRLEPAYIIFDGGKSDDFLFGRVTASCARDDVSDNADFASHGHGGIEEASGAGFSKLRRDGPLIGEPRFHEQPADPLQTHHG